VGRRVTKNSIDADGNVTQTVDGAGTTRFVYDGDNRLTQETYPDGTVAQYSYDAAGRLASKSEPGMPLTTYSYDAARNLTKVSNSLWGPITYTYDAANRLTALGYPNGITTTYTDDADNRLTNLTAAKGGTTLFGDSYTFTARGPTNGGPRRVHDYRVCLCCEQDCAGHRRRQYQHRIRGLRRPHPAGRLAPLHAAPPHH
jgi:YD repeat-containing protein